MTTEDASGIVTAVDELKMAVVRLDERTESRHVNEMESRHSLAAAVDGLRSEAQQHGLAIGQLQAVCSGRAAACSREIAAVVAQGRRHSEELDQLRGGLGEVSQVTAIADIKRSEWRRTAQMLWGVTWKIMTVLAAMGLFGAGAAAVAKAIGG